MCTRGSFRIKLKFKPPPSSLPPQIGLKNQYQNSSSLALFSQSKSVPPTSQVMLRLVLRALLVCSLVLSLSAMVYRAASKYGDGRVGTTTVHKQQRWVGRWVGDGWILPPLLNCARDSNGGTRRGEN